MQATSWAVRSLAFAMAFSLVPATGRAAGFAVHGQSTSQLGNAFAGVAASAPDSSTVWWNPAGMTFVVEKSQAVIVNNIMRTSLKFSNDASAPALGQPLGPEGGDAGTLRLTGALYGHYTFDDRWRVGLGVNFPFGLRTVYDGDWIGRFQAQKSESQALNINPSVAYKVSKELSIGAGVNVQRFKATLTNAVNYTAAVVNAGTTTGAILPGQIPGLLNPAAPGNIAGLEGTAHVHGDDWGLGWNVGVLYKPTPDLSLGAHYRSRIRYTLSGDVSFAAPPTANPVAAPFIAALSAPGAALSSGPVSAKLTVPDSLSLSAVIGNAVNKVDLLFDATWFGWSTLDQVTFVRSNGTALNPLNFSWRDTWRLAAGATYRHTPDVHLRIGYAWDQTVIDDERTRSPRLPDATRHWFTAGSHHRLAKNLTADTGISYVKANEAHIGLRSDPSPAASGVLDGRFRTRSLTLSAQLNWAFD